MKASWRGVPFGGWEGVSEPCGYSGKSIHGSPKGKVARDDVLELGVVCASFFFFNIFLLILKRKGEDERLTLISCLLHVLHFSYIMTSYGKHVTVILERNTYHDRLGHGTEVGQGAIPHMVKSEAASHIQLSL